MASAAEFNLSMNLGSRISSAIFRLRGGGLRAVAQNSGWVLLEHVFRAFTAAVVTAWVARYLGPARYSLLAYDLALMVFLGPIVQLGLNGLVVRDLARHPEATSEILGTATVLRLTSGLLAFLGVVALLWKLDQSHESRVIAVLIAGQLIFQAAENIDLYFQSRLESRFGVLSRLTVSALMAVLRIILIEMHMPLWTFGLALGGEFGFVCLALVLAYRFHPSAARWSFSWVRAKKLLTEGVPYLLSGISVAGYMRLDQLMIRHILGSAALGLYSAVVPLAQIGYMLPMTLATSFAPYIASQSKSGAEAYYRSLRAMFVLLGLASILVSISIAIFAGFAVNLLLGPAYAPAASVLRIYAFTNIAVATGTAWNVWATTSGSGKLLLLNTSLGALVALGANYALIPRYGIVGAAISANLAFMTSALLINAITNREMFFMQLGFPRKHVAVAR